MTRSLTALGPLAVEIGSRREGQPVAPDFLGISTEYRGVERYLGVAPRALDPVFLQLIRNVNPARGVVLRIGGDSTDWTWWPVPHTRRPGGVRYSLNRRWIDVMRAAAQALGAKLILGVNLAANSRRVADVESGHLLRGIGRRWIDAFELGNEPELYGSFSWYRIPGRGYVLARSRGWNYDAFLRNFSQIVGALPRVPIAGPAVGSVPWMRRLGRFAAREPRVRLLTVHRYGLKHCSPSATSTIGNLLAPAAAQGLARSVRKEVNLAHDHRLLLRVDEINAIACGGQLGLSNSFGAALWALDTLFSMARVGVDGVNFHTEPGSWNELFSVRQGHGSWSAEVHPAYYGLAMFAQAAGLGAQFLNVGASLPSSLRVWATQAGNGQVHVVLINKSSDQARVVLLHGHLLTGRGTLERLLAPDLSATRGVTLGGQSFGLRTNTGRLAGNSTAISIPGADGIYRVTLPRASAAMLTFSPQGG